MSKASWILWAVRATGLIVIAILAVGVARSAAPGGATVEPGAHYSDSAGEIALAKASDKLNAKNTDNVYQQQVVNGWVARDYLEVQAKQLDEIGRAMSNPTVVIPADADNRPVLLLMWAVLAVVWLGITSPATWPGSSGIRRSTPVSVGPEPPEASAPGGAPATAPVSAFAAVQ